MKQGKKSSVAVVPTEEHRELAIPERFSRSKYFTPQKVHYRTTGQSASLSPIILISGTTYAGVTVGFRIDLAKRVMIDHPELMCVRVACKRMTKKLTAYTVSTAT